MTPQYKLIISPRALRDLESIHKTIAADSEESAGRVIDQILSEFESLCDVPHRTVVQNGSAGPVRSLVVYPYMVYFRAIDAAKVVRILRVRHGARRPLRRFD